jgi:hypothetical protein
VACTSFETLRQGCAFTGAVNTGLPVFTDRTLHNTVCLTIIILFYVWCSSSIFCDEHVMLLPYCHAVSVTIDVVWIENRIYWSLKQLENSNNYDSLTELHTLKIAVTTAHIVFLVFNSRCLVSASMMDVRFLWVSELSPASVISLSLLTTTNLPVKIKVMLRQSVGQSVLVSSPIWGPRPDFDCCQTVVGLLMWGRPLWRLEGSAVYQYCLSSPA